MTRQLPCAVNLFFDVLFFAFLKQGEAAVVCADWAHTASGSMIGRIALSQIDVFNEAEAPNRLTVAGLLDQYVPSLVESDDHGLSRHAIDKLARLSMCRTAALGRRRYRCDGCEDCPSEVTVFNSCGERCCPQCQGARRHDWLDGMLPTILRGVDYFQIVLTVPHEFLPLFAANEKKVYGLLMRAAWEAIKELLLELGITTGATLILHTWNQRLLPHPHVHALLPAGGLAVGEKDLADQWVSTGEKEREFLDQRLGASFQAHFTKGLARLYRRKELVLTGRFASCKSKSQLQSELESIYPDGFHVMVQPPPTPDSTPEHVLKYLARYISGGPISNGRLVSHVDGQVTFMARPEKQSNSEESIKKQQVTVSGIEFARRWASHILPKQFFRVRHYGMLSNPKRAAYLALARRLIGFEGPSNDQNLDDQKPDDSSDESEVIEPEVVEEADEGDGSSVIYRCPKCKQPMNCIEMSRRPSWRDTMTGPYRPDWYRRSSPHPPSPSPRFKSSHPP